jgi:hypothetical protein
VRLARQALSSTSVRTGGKSIRAIAVTLILRNSRIDTAAGDTLKGKPSGYYRCWLIYSSSVGLARSRRLGNALATALLPNEHLQSEGPTAGWLGASPEVP